MTVSRETAPDALPPHPVQPVVLSKYGAARFRENKIVSYLLRLGEQHGVGLHRLAALPFDDDDREQFAQLTGYSVDGFADLSYASERVVKEAEQAAAVLGKGKKR